MEQGAKIDSKRELLDTLREHWDALRDQFGIRRLAVFGSAALDALAPDSDVDVLVEFKGAATFDGFMDLKFRLEELLGRRVDLVTEKALRPRLRSAIAAECIDVA